MKNNEFQKGIKDIQDIKLSSQEKTDLFAYLDTYTKEHPIQIAPKVSFWSGLFIHYRHSYAIAILLLCVFIGASVTYAAEGALPGDMLYPVKIYVNEPVKAVTRVTPKAKAEFEEEKVIKRLDEVQELVKKGRFDDTKRTQVENEVEKSVNAINTMHVKKERDKDRDRNASSGDDVFRKNLDNRLQNIKKADVELNLDVPKEHDNKGQVEKFETKIRVQLGGFDDGDNKDNNKDNDKKDNNSVRGLLR